MTKQDFLPNNPFLRADPGNKGGGLFIEHPAAVPNIACQTSGSEPDTVEAGLADLLMAVFSDGVWDLEAVLAALEARGSRDSAGSPWTESSLSQHLQQSAARLFATEPGPHHD